MCGVIMSLASYTSLRETFAGDRHNVNVSSHQETPLFMPDTFGSAQVWIKVLIMNDTFHIEF